MKAILFLSVSFIAMLPQIALATGQEVGKGGDIIVCNASTSNDLVGNYSLDYVVTIQGLPAAPVNSWQDSLASIGASLKAKVPELYLSFKQFENDVYNTSYDRAHVWEPAPYGLVSLDDQQIAVQLPANCQAGGRLNLIQAIIRVNPDFSGAEAQIFSYMPTAISDLAVQRPAQASFLFVHEWLWELSSNVDRNRRINRYLHSVEFVSDSAAAALNKLRGMGLSLTGNRYAFDSLQEAVDAAPVGSTVYLLDKTYSDEVNIERAMTLKPASAASHPVIRGGVTISASDVVVDGLIFDRSANSIKRTMIFSGNATFVNNRFFGDIHGGSGIDVWSNVSAVVTNNVFETLSDGVSFGDLSGAPAASSIVSDNVFTDVGSGIDGLAGPLTIERNKFVNAPMRISVPEGRDRVRISNNTMDQCGLYCVWFDDARVDIKGNSFAAAKYGVYIKKTTDAQITGNRFTDNEVGLSLTDDFLGGVIEGNTFERNQTGIDTMASFTPGPNTFIGNGQDVK